MDRGGFERFDAVSHSFVCNLLHRGQVLPHPVLGIDRTAEAS